MADHRPGAPWSSSIRTGRRNTRSLLQADSGCEAEFVYFASQRSRQTLTRGGEEGPRQLAVCSDLSDLCGDVDESTHHRWDSVEAQQPDAEGRDKASGCFGFFF